jgi:hypothetical protein
MEVTLTGATGRIGESLVAALTARGDRVTVLSRDPDRANAALGVPAVRWDPKGGPAPVSALEGRDGVIHLAGEDVGQRWTKAVRRELLDSREQGTRNLVAGIAAAERRPRVLVSASASGYYGPHGGEPVDEGFPPGDDYLAQVCLAWEREAERAEEHGLRVVRMRTGIVLSPDAGALSKMMLPARLGVNGPVAGGGQYLPWIHLDDVVGLYLAALDGEAWSGPVNMSAPVPVTNRAFARALGRVLRRPAFAPVPGFAIRALYGEMSTIVVNGVNMVPRRAQELGFRFAHPEVTAALAATLGRPVPAAAAA